MQFLKNKHLILALFIAPTLAIIAYFSVDYLVSEKPQLAIQGNSYKLVAKSNCRYQSGLCTLENGDISVQLTAQHIAPQQVKFILKSEHVIQHAVISFVDKTFSSKAKPMQQSKDYFSAVLAIIHPEITKLRLAFTINNTNYYAQTSSIFIDYKTSFSQQNFTQ